MQAPCGARAAATSRDSLLNSSAVLTTLFLCLNEYSPVQPIIIEMDGWRFLYCRSKWVTSFAMEWSNCHAFGHIVYAITETRSLKLRDARQTIAKINDCLFREINSERVNFWVIITPQHHVAYSCKSMGQFLCMCMCILREEALAFIWLDVLFKSSTL